MPNAPARYASMEEGEFEVFQNIPVFDEHEGDDGVIYDKSLLGHIAQNNNDRIDDTGDWCPIIAGHTPDENGVEQPTIIGYAGPFKVSVIGNKKPRACIFADFRIHKDHSDTFRKNPRRSVELWPEDKPEDRFFDPIAVLGAETPKRPLGLVYAKAGQPLRYQRPATSKPSYKYDMEGGGPTASSAGAHNAFIPGSTGKKKKKPITFNMEGLNMQADEIAQLIEALVPVIQSEVADQMNAIHTNDADADIIEEAAEVVPTPPMEPGAEMPMDPPMNVPAEEPVAEVPAEEPVGDMPEPAGQLPVEEEDERTPFAKYAHGKCMEYMMGDDDDMHKTGAHEKCMKFAAGLDDDDAIQMGKVMEGGDNDDEKAFYNKLHYGLIGESVSAGEGAVDSGIDFATQNRKRYGLGEYAGGALGTAAGTAVGGPTGGVVGGAVGSALGGAADEAVENNKREEGDTMYQKKYAKSEAARSELAQKNAKLNEQLRDVRFKERYAKRCSAIETLRHQGVVIPDDEVDAHEHLDNEQWTEHTERIAKHYQNHASPQLASLAHAKDNRSADTKGDANSAEALEIALKFRKEGKDVSYKAVMNNLIKNNGTYVEESTATK